MFRDYEEFCAHHRAECARRRREEEELRELKEWANKPSASEPTTKAATAAATTPATVTPAAVEAEVVRKTDGVNGAGAGLVYKTRENARVADEPAVVRKNDREYAPDEEAEMLAASAAEYATSRTPNVNPYPWWTWVQRFSDYQLNGLHAAIGKVVAEERKSMRATVKREGDAIRGELAQRARELDLTLREQVLEVGRALREEAKAAREQQAQQDAVTRYEIGVVRRELAMLREEVALERGFQALKAEIAVAKSSIPQVPAIEARVAAELATYKAEQKRLERELAQQKDRLGKLRVEQSVTSFSLKKLEEARQPVVELKFESADGCFTMKDMHPDAEQAWRRFAAEMVAANEGTMFPNDPTGRVVALPSRKAGAA